MDEYGLWVAVDDIYDDNYVKCPFCDVEWCVGMGTPMENEMYFCPKCGHDMRGDTGVS